MQKEIIMLSNNDKIFIAATFNDSGYVLNFSDSSFDTFTLNSVGIPIKTKYGLSKAKSLGAFIDEASDEEIIKLTKDLIEYTERSESLEEKASSRGFINLKQMISKFPEGNSFSSVMLKNVKDDFNDVYIENQLQLMLTLVETSPTDVIGKSKELLESCFKHILDFYEEPYSNKDSIGSLRKKTFVKLNLDMNENVSSKNNQDVKKILSSLNQIVDGLGSLRNDKGDGHGKGQKFAELPERYAQLAMNASLTIVHFTWDTYKYLNK